MKFWNKQRSLIYALHAKRIPENGARITYTFGLGGIAVFAALVTTITGLALTFYYVPTPAEAHSSIVLINDVASFGWLVRGLHFWAAQLMVVAATLHLARIVFTGGYRPPREVNWLIGLALLVATLIWNFSGFVLRWDEGAYWALLIGTNIVRDIPVGGQTLYRLLVGDGQIGASALLRFYGWHVFGLTLVGSFGIVYHLWRIRKDGGISRPVLYGGKTLAYISAETLLFREFITAVLVAAGLVLVSVLSPVPIGAAANLNSGVTASVRAPWIFLWVQNLLRTFPPLWAGVIVPLALLVMLAVLPWLDQNGPGRAIWFARTRWKPQCGLVGLAVIIVALSLLEVLS